MISHPGLLMLTWSWLPQSRVIFQTFPFRLIVSSSLVYASLLSPLLSWERQKLRNLFSFLLFRVNVHFYFVYYWSICLSIWEAVRKVEVNIKGEQRAPFCWWTSQMSLMTGAGLRQKLRARNESPVSHTSVEKQLTGAVTAGSWI